MLEVGKKYNFSVYPSNILGTNFKNVTVVGLFNAAMASNFIDIDALHVAVFPHLPQGIPNNPRNYDYVAIKTLSGDTTVLGLPWINEDSIILVDSISAEVTISNITSADYNRISDALIQNGFHQFTIRILE